MIIEKHQEIFEIRVKKDKEKGYSEVEKVRIAGERCSFVGFEEFEFAVDARTYLAEDVICEDEDSEDSEFYGLFWVVTELRTGCQVCLPKNTKEEALAEAQKILDLKGIDAVRSAVQKALEMVGAA